MKKPDITTKLNIKIGSVVVLLVLSLIVNQWITLQERKQECMEQLDAITAFLVQEIPPECFSESVHEKGGAGKTAGNKRIQSILANVLVPSHLMKFGVYSRQHGRIVAIGPESDNSVLAAADAELFTHMIETDAACYGEQKNSVIWYGDPILYHIRPVMHNGAVVGNAFACANLYALNAEIWNRTTNTFLAIFIAIVFVIILFQEVIIRLKKDLVQFAEKVVDGRAKDFTSLLPELNPVLTYITEQTENLARLDRLNIIGEMAAGIAHEVRNPMTTVRGFLQFMSMKKEFETSKERFALMIDELDRANNIITEFLSLAKNKNMDFHDVDLNKVISDVFPLMQADAFRSNCQIETKLAPVPAILVDENSIRQLILNMVRNAIEAMPQGGGICISTVESGQKVLLSIQDEGVGISDELLKKLGTPFFTTKDSGTGLGLAVCYRIVERHGATITVGSKPGEGTTFTVEFPVSVGVDI